MKMKFNIIAILVIICVLNTSKCFLRHYRPDSTLIGNDGIRFMQKAVSTEEESKEKSQAGYKYNAELTIVKETDPKETVATSTKCNLVLDKKGPMVTDVLTGKILSEMDYLNFIFFEGKVMFENMKEFEEIKTEIYKDIIKKIHPRVSKVAESKGEKYFTNFCFFAIREELKMEGNKNEGKIITSVIFCLDKQSTESELEKFRQDFRNKYADRVEAENDFNLIQRYRIKQNIEIQYYTGMGKKSAVKEVPEFFTAFAEEGMTLNKNSDNRPSGVKHAFRYDQVVDCAGYSAAQLKKALDPELAADFREDECCISYLLNWDGQGSKIMICSTYDKLWRCKAEIKIIRSTMFDQCMVNKLVNFVRIRKSGREIHTLKIALTERLAAIETMHLMIDVNLKTYPNDNTKEFKAYESQSLRNKKDFMVNIATLDYELSSPGKKSGGCREYTEEVAMKKAAKSEDKDMDKVDLQQEKLMNTPQAIAFAFQERMIVHFCSHYYDYIKGKVSDEKKDAPKGNLKKDIAKEMKKMNDKVVDEVKEQEDILRALKKIKDSLGDHSLKYKEINHLRRMFMDQPLLANDILNPLCFPKKEWSLRILKSTTDEAKSLIKECGKKPMMVKFIPDPTHFNSTLCDDDKKTNKTKSDDVNLIPVDKNPYDPKDPNKKQDKQKEEEQEKEKQQKSKYTLPLDDKTLYLDDGDFYRNMKIDLILDYQNRKQQIIVPRSIPNVVVIPKPIIPVPPKPIVPKVPETISEEDELVIPVTNRNPGVIKTEDEKNIRKIVEDNKISTCDKVPKLPLPTIPKPDYIGYPKYNNFTIIKDDK